MTQLVELKSYKAIEDVLYDLVLEDFQCIDVIKGLVFKKAIYMYDPGMGKTLEAAAIMKMLKTRIPSAKFIMFVEKSQFIETPDKIHKHTGLSVLTVSGEESGIEDKMMEQDFTRYDVLMLSHRTLNNAMVMALLYKEKSKYLGVFVDEAHKVCNFMESSSAWMLRGLLRQFEYRYALTATPVTSSMKQVAQLAHMFDWETFDDVPAIVRHAESGNSVVSLAPDFFINRTRRDLGIISNYIPHIELIEPEPHQENIYSGNITALTKGKGAFRQAGRLRDIILSNRPNKGLVYIRQHEVREWVLPFLDEAGIRYECINGRVTNLDKRREISRKFNAGELDVLITSVTTSLDLDCDYVVFHEFCTDIKQMMGRAERGLNPKTLDLYFIFTRRTGEIDYFMKYFYKRSLSIQMVLEKDYSELIRAGAMLSNAL
jgi:ERCC4-related helicase